MTSDGSTDSTTAPEQAPDQAAEQAPELPLLTLREPLPEVTVTPPQLAEVAARLAAGTGPVAIDAERASGYRYSQRAYLIQIRREGSGTALIDPIDLDLAPLATALEGTEWILHAATQDLPCLTEVGLTPSHLFDTELAGRLLGYPKVGLATLVEEICGFRMRKEHSAADWSTRPLPDSWLLYAALDVEVLVELRDVMEAELTKAGKREWAAQEFEHLRHFTPAVRTDPWRRTSGMHKVRGRRGLAAVRELWTTRDEIARARDVSPSRIIPDNAIVVAASALSADRPTDRAALKATKGFHGRGAERYAARWVEALERARTMAEDDLPARSISGDGPPPARAWADKDPAAAARLSHARAALAELSERVDIPAENLLTPDLLRRVLWAPPRTRDPEQLDAEVGSRLAELGARPWQIELCGPLIVAATLEDQVALDDQDGDGS